jgi:crotonobetainyl-CoA:carnitine CoA-transferase CaiB-like acyl-CoA transferase
MILAQLGADVVKVESPEGDDSRGWPPHVGDRSVVYRNMSVGKRGVVVDLKQPQGVEVALALARSATVVLQTMRPGVADRLGIGAAALRAENPDVIYYDMNAFGTGPVGRAMPGYDPMAQAYTGIMEMTGHEGSPPTRCAPSIIDLGTGMWIAMGILAAVLARQRGQRVQSLETALVDTAFSMVCYQATTALMTGERPPRAGSGNPIAAPYQCYQASDAPFMLAAGNQKLWLRIVEVLGAPALAVDARFKSGTLRSANRHALESELNARFAKSTADEWVSRLSAAGIPATRVYGLEQAVASDIARERRTFVESEGVPLVRLPWLVDGEPIPWSSAAPAMGQHTREVLREIGFSRERIDALVAAGAVREAAPR